LENLLEPVTEAAYSDFGGSGGFFLASLVKKCYGGMNRSSLPLFLFFFIAERTTLFLLDPISETNIFSFESYSLMTMWESTSSCSISLKRFKLDASAVFELSIRSLFG
jgi:hypothetical protein